MTGSTVPGFHAESIPREETKRLNMPKRVGMDYSIPGGAEGQSSSDSHPLGKGTPKWNIVVLSA